MHEKNEIDAHKELLISSNTRGTENLSYALTFFFKNKDKFSYSISSIVNGIQVAQRFLKLFINQIKRRYIMKLLKGNSNLMNQMPLLFDDIFNRDIFNWGSSNFSNTNTTIPAVNIKETPENFQVEVAAPGMTKKDFKIELDGNMLSISSEKTNEREDNENEKYSRKEFSYQSFYRTFNLSKDVVDVDKIQAKYENGLLQLLIPKKEEAKQKPPRLIQIS